MSDMFAQPTPGMEDETGPRKSNLDTSLERHIRHSSSRSSPPMQLRPTFDPPSMETTSSELYPPQDGDFVIQTSDAVLFGVHYLLLQLSSPVMSALGTTKSDQPTPASVSEDSRVFQDLLSFIYPDKTSTIFASLDGLVPVLGAAIKYEMKAIVGALQTQIMSKMSNGQTFREALLYDDPLGVYAKAKEFDLGDLANAAANATLNIDISVVPETGIDLTRMPALWLWQLFDLRKQRVAWLQERCKKGFYFARLDSQYQHDIDSFGPYIFEMCSCQCGVSGSRRDIPASLLEMIEAYPCARAIRRIDLNLQMKCLRCGAAATAYLSRLCDAYETTFGIF